MTDEPRVNTSDRPINKSPLTEPISDMSEFAEEPVDFTAEPMPPMMTPRQLARRRPPSAFVTPSPRLPGSIPRPSSAVVHAALSRRNKPAHYMLDPASLPVSPRQPIVKKQQVAASSKLPEDWGEQFRQRPPIKASPSPRANVQFASWHSHRFGRGAGYRQKASAPGDSQRVANSEDGPYVAQGIMLSKDGVTFTPRPTGVWVDVKLKAPKAESTVPQRVRVIY